MELKRNPLTTGIGICLVAAFCNLLWGSAYPCIKLGYQWFQIPGDQTFSQILFAGIRFFLAGILAILFGSLVSRKFLVPKKSSWPMILKLSAFQTVIQYFFFYVGLANTSGVKASIIAASNVFMSLLVSCLVFRLERFTSGKIIGCLIGFSGVILVNLNGSGFDPSMKWTGEGAIVLSTVSYAVSTVLIKRYSNYENPVLLSGYQFAAGGLIMIAIGLAGGGQIHPLSSSSYFILVYLALLSAAAYSLWGILLQLNPVSKVSVYGFLNPVFGVALSALLLNEGTEALGWQAAVALLLVCSGIWAVNHQWGKSLNQSHPS